LHTYFSRTIFILVIIHIYTIYLYNPLIHINNPSYHRDKCTFPRTVWTNKRSYFPFLNRKVHIFNYHLFIICFKDTFKIYHDLFSFNNKKLKYMPQTKLIITLIVVSNTNTFSTMNYKPKMTIILIKTEAVSI